MTNSLIKHIDLMVMIIIITTAAKMTLEMAEFDLIILCFKPDEAGCCTGQEATIASRYKEYLLKILMDIDNFSAVQMRNQ
jgi:hypothetical protein